MKTKNVNEVSDIVGISKSLTIKLGEGFIKVNVWIQKSLNGKKEKVVLDEIEKVIDEKLEEAINKYQSKSVDYGDW